MAERKIDYFGTFLDNSAKRAQAEKADPANEVLKALRGGSLAAAALIPLTDNSVSRFLEVSEQLIKADWVTKNEQTGMFELTPQGRQLAATLA